MSSSTVSTVVSDRQTGLIIVVGTMAFLYPLAWLGALALAIPLWLHFQRRDESHLVRFSALRFLEDAPLARRRPLLPRDWLLLLLRLLALLLLVAAFAWPYQQTELDQPLQESRIYILDRTLSHQAGDQFQKARDFLVHELSTSTPETQVAVVDLASTPRTLVHFGDDPIAAAETIKNLEISHQRGSYLSAFRLASDVLSRSLGTRKQIVLLGDSQQNQWREGLHAPPFLEDIQVTLPEVSNSSLPNLALHNPDVRVFYAGDRNIAACTVQVTRLGNIPSADLSFYANGRRVNSQKVDFPKDATSLTLSGEVAIDRSRWFRGEFRITGKKDSLADDDRAYFSLPPLREGQLVLLTNSIYMRTALSPQVMRGRWRTRMPDLQDGHPPLELQPEDEAVWVDSDLLGDASVRELVLDAVNSTRGVILNVNLKSSLTRQFLRDLGVDVETSGSQQPVAPEPFRYLFAEHPIFQSFRSADFGDLSKVTVGRHRTLKTAEAMPLAFSQSGDPLIVEMRPGKGKALVFAFALDRSETNWPLLPTFVPFLDKCLQYVRPDVESQETTYAPDETCVWHVRPGENVREITVKRVDADDDQPVARAIVAAGHADLTVPDEPGHYEILYDEEEEVRGILAVNPPEQESQLRFESEPSALDGWTITSPQTPEEAAASPLDVPLSTIEILRQNIWWWLLLAGFTAVFCETIWLTVRRTTP